MVICPLLLCLIFHKVSTWLQREFELLSNLNSVVYGIYFHTTKTMVSYSDSIPNKRSLKQVLLFCGINLDFVQFNSVFVLWYYQVFSIFLHLILIINELYQTRPP